MTVLAWMGAYIYYTPNLWRDGCNSFGIVCLFVRLTLGTEWTDIRSWILAWRSSGRISRSSSKIKVIGQRSRSPGQKMFHCCFNCLSPRSKICIDVAELPRKWLRNTKWGVFKGNAVLFVWENNLIMSVFLTSSSHRPWNEYQFVSGKFLSVMYMT